MNAVADLHRAHGGPLGRASLRVEPEDFRVTEIPPMEPTGDGEHLLLCVRKRGWTTDAVAGLLARRLGVSRGKVSYAGMKDRWAVTEQYFSVQLPRVEDLAVGPLDEGVELLSLARHRRKLRRGALLGNRFVLRLRDMTDTCGALSARLAAIARFGVPNYFGEQRFGREGDNVQRARALLSGEFRTRNRNLRGILLSAARSHLFNRILDVRVSDGSWDHALPGEILMLDGRSACFAAELDDPRIPRRLALMEVHPTGPLAGRGGLLPSSTAAAPEHDVLREERTLVEGLERAGLEGARRALRLRVRELNWYFESPDSLVLRFTLPPGAYATAVVRELCEASIPDRRDAAVRDDAGTAPRESQGSSFLSRT